MNVTLIAVTRREWNGRWYGPLEAAGTVLPYDFSSFRFFPKLVEKGEVRCRVRAGDVLRVKHGNNSRGDLSVLAHEQMASALHRQFLHPADPDVPAPLAEVMCQQAARGAIELRFEQVPAYHQVIRVRPLAGRTRADVLATWKPSLDGLLNALGRMAVELVHPASVEEVQALLRMHAAGHVEAELRLVASEAEQVLLDQEEAVRADAVLAAAAGEGETPLPPPGPALPPDPVDEIPGPVVAPVPPVPRMDGVRIVALDLPAEPVQQTRKRR